MLEEDDHSVCRFGSDNETLTNVGATQLTDLCSIGSSLRVSNETTASSLKPFLFR